MPRTARPPHAWLTAGMALAAALVWGSHALRAVVTDVEPSAKALFACGALVFVGFAVGVMTGFVAAPKRAKRPRAEQILLAEMRVFFVILAIAFIGLAASPVLDDSREAWDWAFLVCWSLLGGLNLGGAFMWGAEEELVDQLRRSASASNPEARGRSLMPLSRHAAERALGDAPI